MVDKAKSLGGKKGAAIKAAKKQASAEGNPVMLSEFGVIVDKDGSVVNMANAPDQAAQAVEDVEVEEAMGTDPEAAAVDAKPGEIQVDHIEGTGFLIGERLPLSGEYVHIARAATKKVVEEFLTMRDLGISAEAAMVHLNERHGDGAITYGTEKPMVTEGIDSGAEFITRAEGDMTSPAPPSMAPLTEPGVEASTSMLKPGAADTAQDIEAPDQPKAILDAVAESAEIEEGMQRAGHEYEEKAVYQPEAVPFHPDPPPMPNTVLARAFYYVEYNGLSETDALTLAQTQLSGLATSGVLTPATPGDGEMLGPDKTMVEAYQKRMETYVAPRLECEIKVENPDGDDWVFPMPVRFLDYLLRSAEWETIKRRREVTPADRLQQILREYRRDDQEVRLLMAPGAASGPAGTFNPASGRWE